MSEYNEDELIPPSWLSDEFIQNVLIKCENDESVKVNKLTITPGTVKGDHYASIMFRIVAVYDTVKSAGNTKSMIIKAMPEMDGVKKDMLKELFVFETEISMYSKTIPALEAELRKIGDDTVLGAKMLYHSLGERKCIIFEDLVPKGYATIKDRTTTIAEVKAALLKLAKWHAVSYKLAAEGDETITKYSESFLNMKDIDKVPFMTTGIEQFIKLVECDDELKEYAPKLRAIQNDLLVNCTNSFNSYRDNPNSLGVNVLCHGDFHLKNLMFKWDDKDELEDVMLLDFQISFFGPAVLDVLYAVYMLFGWSLRKDHREELIYYYASNFIDTLKRLNFKGEYPSISDFYIDILRHKHWELFLFSTFVPMWNEFTKGQIDTDALMNSKEARAKLYENKVYINEVKRLLPVMYHMGYFD